MFVTFFKQNRKWIIPIVIFIAIIQLFFFFSLQIEDVDRLNNEYRKIHNRDSTFGKVVQTEVSKGPAFITFKNGEKVWLRSSINYNYSPPFLDAFIKIGDSIAKKNGSDSLFIYRNHITYFFILDGIIRKDIKIK